MSDIGAIEFGRWHASHFSWKIGATSLVNVSAAGCCDTAKPVSAMAAATPTKIRTGLVILITRSLCEMNAVESGTGAQFPSLAKEGQGVVRSTSEQILAVF